MDYYNTIEKQGTAEFKDRGSKFNAYAFPIVDIVNFKRLLNEIKKEHSKASHHCFAYRLGIDGNIFRANDDGEPSGSAGKQILGQIDGRQLTNVLIIVVRYFGGTLLGVPGLINAYKTAAALALQTTPIVQKPLEINYSLQFDYTVINDVMMVIRKFKCTIHKQEMQLFCNLEIGIPKTNLELCLLRLKELRGIEVTECRL